MPSLPHGEHGLERLASDEAGRGELHFLMAAGKAVLIREGTCQWWQKISSRVRSSERSSPVNWVMEGAVPTDGDDGSARDRGMPA